MLIYSEQKEDANCDTCKQKIDCLPYRVVNLKQNNLELKSLNFHYFFPCWDLDLFVQRYGNSKIVSAGFCYKDDIIKNPEVVRNMENNLDLW